MLFRFRLVHAVKPHTSQVTSIVLSQHHNVIVTLSDDNTAFFFKFGQSEGGTIFLEPARCVRLPEKCLNLHWTTVGLGGEGCDIYQAKMFFETGKTWTFDVDKGAH